MRQAIGRKRQRAFHVKRLCRDRQIVQRQTPIGPMLPLRFQRDRVAKEFRVRWQKQRRQIARQICGKARCAIADTLQGDCARRAINAIRCKPDSGSEIGYWPRALDR